MLSTDQLSPTGPGGLSFGTTLLSTAGSTTGITLDHATANTLKVRTATNSADAAITGGNLTLSGTLTYGGVTVPSTVTGTGSMVLATGPTISSLTVTSTLTYGGVTLSSTVVGTGSMVLSAAPSITGTATFASLSATGVGTFQNGVAASASIATAAIAFSSTPSFGVFFGAGTPTITAVTTGSLYLNQTGSSSSTRLFVFSSASTWINFTSAS